MKDRYEQALYNYFAELVSEAEQPTMSQPSTAPKTRPAPSFPRGILFKAARAAVLIAVLGLSYGGMQIRNPEADRLAAEIADPARLEILLEKGAGLLQNYLFKLGDTP